MSSKREDGECLTARAVLRRMNGKQPVFDQWLVDTVNAHPEILKEGGMTLEGFNALAAEQKFVPTPPPSKPDGLVPLPRPRKAPELVQEPPRPKPALLHINLRGALPPPKPPKPPKAPPPPLTPEQVPPRIFEAAEGFCHDFGLSIEQRDDLIRAVRRAFPGEYPKNGELRLAFYRHLLSTGAADPLS